MGTRIKIDGPIEGLADGLVTDHDLRRIDMYIRAKAELLSAEAEVLRIKAVIDASEDFEVKVPSMLLTLAAAFFTRDSELCINASVEITGTALLRIRYESEDLSLPKGTEPVAHEADIYSSGFLDCDWTDLLPKYYALMQRKSEQGSLLDSLPMNDTMQEKALLLELLGRYGVPEQFGSKEQKVEVETDMPTLDESFNHYNCAHPGHTEDVSCIERDIACSKDFLAVMGLLGSI